MGEITWVSSSVSPVKVRLLSMLPLPTTGGREAVGGAVFEAVLLGEQGVELVLVAEDMVPARHRLVIPVTAFVVGVEKVVGEAGGSLSGSVGPGNIDRIVGATGLMRFAGITLPGNGSRQ